MANEKVFPRYTEESYPPIPNGLTRFFRTCIAWQMVRFVILNLKIMRIVIGGHN